MSFWRELRRRNAFRVGIAYLDRPRISPDGRTVAYTWYHAPRFDGDVYVKQIGRNTEPIRITAHEFFDGEVSWSPNGEKAAFLCDEDGRQAGASIYTAPALGGHDGPSPGRVADGILR